MTVNWISSNARFDYTKEILEFVYLGSIVTNRPQEWL